MKKYYAIDSAFSFTNKETWEKMYSLRLIQQSTKFAVRWSTSKYFNEKDFYEIFWEKINKERDSLGLAWLYLIATESIELTKEIRQWYWIRNYKIMWINKYTSKDWVPMVVVSWLLETDYSVQDLKKFYMTKEQYNEFFEEVIDDNDQFNCDWLKGRNIEVIEKYSYSEELPYNFDSSNETN